jgi:rubrerythrin
VEQRVFIGYTLVTSYEREEAKVMADEGRVFRYRANLDDEQNSAYLYRILVEVESDERLSRVYLRLAETEEKHLRFWEERLREAGEAVPERRMDWRTRMLLLAELLEHLCSRKPACTQTHRYRKMCVLAAL